MTAFSITCAEPEGRAALRRCTAQIYERSILDARARGDEAAAARMADALAGLRQAWADEGRGQA